MSGNERLKITQLNAPYGSIGRYFFKTWIPAFAGMTVW